MPPAATEKFPQGTEPNAMGHYPHGSIPAPYPGNNNEDPASLPAGPYFLNSKFEPIKIKLPVLALFPCKEYFAWYKSSGYGNCSVYRYRGVQFVTYLSDPPPYELFSAYNTYIYVLEV
jgi:hypothetical protein